MSDTPETDSHAWSDHSEGILHKVVEANFARKLERERDEANYFLKELSEADGQLKVRIDELCKVLQKAERERDEAREELQKLEGAYEDATNYYARIIELTYERDETRKEVKYWQELYRTVSVY